MCIQVHFTFYLTPMPFDSTGCPHSPGGFWANCHLFIFIRNVVNDDIFSWLVIFFLIWVSKQNLKEDKLSNRFSTKYIVSSFVKNGSRLHFLSQAFHLACYWGIGELMCLCFPVCCAVGGWLLLSFSMTICILVLFQWLCWLAYNMFFI